MTHAAEALASSDEAAHTASSDDEKSPEEIVSSEPEHEPFVEEPVTSDVQVPQPQESSAEEVISDTE